MNKHKELELIARWKYKQAIKSEMSEHWQVVGSMGTSVGVGYGQLIVGIPKEVDYKETEYLEL